MITRGARWRPEDQNKNDQGERNGQFELTGDQIGADQILRDADDQSADHGPDRTGDAAEQRPGESIDQHAAHHVRIKK
jgi:hypothetical protein